MTKTRRAFTLVEILFSLALVGALLVAMNQFIFSMGELWGRNRQQRLFEQHVRAVTHYLEDLLQRGALAPGADRGLRIAPMPTAGPLLTFDLPAGDRLLPWPEAPLPDVQCALGIAADRGLTLYWQSRWELGFETAPPRATMISPLVKRLDYDYYQGEGRAWQTMTAPAPEQDGRQPLPARLRLHFQYDRFTADAVVNLPARVAALPAF